MSKRKCDDENKKNIQTVKCCLKRIINDPDILDQIERDVIEMSNLAQETSLLLYYTFYEKLYNGETDFKNFMFLTYFMKLKENATSTKGYDYTLDKRYTALRNGLPKYDGNRGRGNIFKSLAKNYKTVFENNIWMHAYSRVRKLLKKLNPEATKEEIYQNLSHLFDKDSKHEKTLNFYFDWKKAHFYPIEYKPMQFVYDFFKIQQLNESNEWKNFTLVPLYKAGRKHIQYDKESFLGLLGAIGKRPQKPSEKTGKPVNIECKDGIEWNDYLKLKKNRKFHGSFTTDGISICVKYDKKEKNHDDVPRKKPKREFDLEIGMDPGLRVFIAAVKQTPDGVYENVKISSATYQYDNGAHDRKRKRLKWTATIDKEIEQARQKSELPISATSTSNYDGFVKFHLEWMKKKQEIYNQRKISRLKIDEFKNKHRTLDRYINKHLVGDNKNVAVYFGDSSIASNSPMKGYVRVPGKLLKHKLAIHPHVTLIMVDEFRTSKLCSFCHQEVIMYPVKQRGESHPHRFTVCPPCKRVCHRDINAANNMLRLGQLGPDNRPKPFQRPKEEKVKKKKSKKKGQM